MTCKALLLDKTQLFNVETRHSTYYTINIKNLELRDIVCYCPNLPIETSKPRNAPTVEARAIPSEYWLVTLSLYGVNLRGQKVDLTYDHSNKCKEHRSIIKLRNAARSNIIEYGRDGPCIILHFLCSPRTHGSRYYVMQISLEHNRTKETYSAMLEVFFRSRLLKQPTETDIQEWKTHATLKKSKKRKDKEDLPTLSYNESAVAQDLFDLPELLVNKLSDELSSLI